MSSASAHAHMAYHDPLTPCPLSRRMAPCRPTRMLRALRTKVSKGMHAWNALQLSSCRTSSIPSGTRSAGTWKTLESSWFMTWSTRVLPHGSTFPLASFPSWPRPCQIQQHHCSPSVWCAEAGGRCVHVTTLCRYHAVRDYRY